MGCGPVPGREDLVTGCGLTPKIVLCTIGLLEYGTAFILTSSLKISSG